MTEEKRMSTAVVYTNLCLDDLCALEELSRHYEAVHVIVIEASEFGTKPMHSKTLDTFDSVIIKLNQWFKVVHLSSNILTKDGFDYTYADCYLLGKATKLVYDLANGKRFSNLFLSIGSMHGFLAFDLDKEVRADVPAYTLLEMYMGCHIPSCICAAGFDMHGYYDNNYEFLNEYIQAAEESEEPPYCRSLQAVKYAHGLLEKRRQAEIEMTS